MSDRITISTQTYNAGQLLSNIEEVKRAMQNLVHIKKVMATVAGTPASYAALALTYGVSETDAVALFSRVTNAEAAIVVTALDKYVKDIGLI